MIGSSAQPLASAISMACSAQPDAALDRRSSHALGDSERGETADLEVWPIDPASQRDGFFQVLAARPKMEGPELGDAEIHECGRPGVGRTVHFVVRLRGEHLLQRAHCLDRRLQIATAARERQLRAGQAQVETATAGPRPRSSASRSASSM